MSADDREVARICDAARQWCIASNELDRARVNLDAEGERVDRPEESRRVLLGEASDACSAAGDRYNRAHAELFEAVGIVEALPWPKNIVAYCCEPEHARLAERLASEEGRVGELAARAVLLRSERDESERLLTAGAAKIRELKAELQAASADEDARLLRRLDERLARRLAECRTNSGRHGDGGVTSDGLHLPCPTCGTECSGGDTRPSLLCCDPRCPLHGAP